MSFVRTIFLCLLAVGSQWSASAAEKPIDFNRDIRPLLSDNCFACHGPDEETRKAKLRLDRHEDALKPAKSGDAAIVPGDAEKSTLIQRIATTDEDDIMPPPKTGKKLTAQQIDLLKRWISEGAQWQTHWAFETPKRPELPKVQNTDWPKDEIDHFVLARMEKENLQPAPPADKTTLARRVAFDLTGLPPTPAEVDAFLADESPEAYEKLVDRFLASPRYGENMARYWLDAARYADSHGYHIDSERSMWKWRDWVTKAFNDNMPYDQFTVEQLAGDLLPEATIDQKIASGYVRCNMSTGEGGAIEEEYQAKYTFDRIETTGTIWMGMTLTCARCHTHKYDPITHKEYYQLYSFFNNLNEPVMDGNRPNPDPFIKIPSPEQKERQEWLKKQIADGQKKLEEPLPELDKAQEAWEQKWHQKFNAGWVALKPENIRTLNEPQFKVLADQSVSVEGKKGVHEIRIKLGDSRIGALRLEVLPEEGAAKDRWFLLTELEAEVTGPRKEGEETKPRKLKFSKAVADISDPNNRVDRTIDGNHDTGWAPSVQGGGEPHTAVFILSEPLDAAKDSELKLRVVYDASKERQALGRFRITSAQSEELLAVLHPPKQEPWHLIGPFKSPDPKAALVKDYEPEREIDFKKGYPGVRDEVRWHARGDLEDGRNHLLVNELHGVHGVYYFYRPLRLTAPTKVDFTLRADDLYKIWVNGVLLGERTEKEKLGEGPLKVAVHLQAGEHKVLVKVVTQVGASYFSFKQYFNQVDNLAPELAALFATGNSLQGEARTQVRNHFRRASSPEWKELADNVANWRSEDEKIEREIPTTMVAREMDKRRETFMLLRGEYDQKGEKVEPGVPAVLPPWPSNLPANRLGLAKWLLDPSHPLTARVTVNRFWQQYFGVGLVKTTEDFGMQGEHPSHPDLLDWLATEFVRSGWDVKRLQKLIVLSATYRQSSRITPDLLAKDPENRLLARGPRFRLDAEVLRDTALYVGGLLVERRGGPSAKPYEPPGLWEAVSFNNSQKYIPDKGEGQYRRSMYTHWKRQSPPPSMLIFDAPTREYCVVRRPRTNTPLQALALLNDPQIVEASRAFAERMIREGGASADKRIEHGFRMVTCRKPNASETEILKKIYEEQASHFEADQESAEKLIRVGDYGHDTSIKASELAAWTTVASMLINLDETLTKN